MKGGVGKTTTAVQLACGFAQRGLRVLAVDADPQGNLTHFFGCDAQPGLMQWLLGEVEWEQAVRPAVRPGLSVIPISPAAFGLESHLASRVQRETFLRRRLADVEGYDLAVIDTSPAMSLLTYNALLASDGLVMPVVMDSMSLLGARQTLDGVAEIRSLWPEQRLPLWAVVPTAVAAQTHASRAILQLLADDAELGPALFSPGVRQAIDLTYATAARQTIWEYAPKSRAAQDFTDLMDRIAGKCDLQAVPSS